MSLVLSSALCGADTRVITHNFQGLFSASPKELVVTNENHTGTIGDFVYTCSNGAEFKKESPTASQLAVYLDKSNAQVTTTQITNLDSLHFQFAPTSYLDFYVDISTDGISWTNVPVLQKLAGVNAVKLPSAGDYYVRIRRAATDVYIKQIKYIYIDLSDCPNCFIYKP